MNDKLATNSESFDAREAFEKGQHREVVDRVRSPGKTGAEAMALISSYSFLGRLSEALELWRLKSKLLSPEERARTRFALAVAHTRVSKFKKARTWLKANLDDSDCKDLPDVYQGLALYHYYLGNFEKSASNGQKALSLALSRGDGYMHALAIDLYGHALVQTGKRSQGLQKLTQAKELAKRAGTSDPFTSAKIVYEAESGLRPQTAIADLEALISAADTDDSYTRANLSLELARQLTLRGQWQRARRTLDDVSQVIYGFENRRQEALLQLRLAELSYRQGDAASATHFVQAARRCLIKIADQAYEVRILGLELKIEKNLLGREPAQESLARLNELTSTNPGSINARILSRTFPSASTKLAGISPGEDPLGDLLDLAANHNESALPLLIEAGYLGLWPEYYGLKAGQSALVVLEDGQWIAVRKEGVVLSRVNLSSLSFKILRLLAKGCVSKEDLAKTVWNYEYDPIRHDSMIYTALASLRRALGQMSHWIETQDEGWALGDRGHKIVFVDRAIQLVDHAPTGAGNRTPVEPEGAELNWRQLKALSKKSTIEAWTVPNYREMFQVSTMTAWRDLDGLAKTGYLKRIGRGRATVYLESKCE